MSAEMQAMTPFDSFGDPSDLALPQQYGGGGGLAGGGGGAGSGSGGGGGGGGDGARPRGLLTTIHRTLRGRYWIALPLAAVFGLAGAAFGWKSQKPLYKSDGSLTIEYEKQSVFHRDQGTGSSVIPLYEEFLMTQTIVITSRGTIDKALEDKEWQDTGRGDNALVAKNFVENLVVEHPRQTEVIHIAFTDRDPHVAAAGTGSVVRAYEKLYSSKVTHAELQQIDLLEGRIRKLKGDQKMERDAIGIIAAEYGTEDFDAIYQQKVQTFNRLDAQLNEARLQLALREGKGEPGKLIDNLSNEQIGMIDSQMERKLANLADAEANLKRLEVTLGQRHTKVLEARNAVEQARNVVEQYAKDYKTLNKKLVDAGAGSGRGPMFDKLSQSVESIKAEIASLTELRAAAAEEMKTVGGKQIQIKSHRERIKDLDDEVHELEHRRDQIRAEGQSDGRLKVISYGDTPIMPFKDNRQKMAAAFGFGGAAAPLLLFMLLGYMDKRFRYSDEADGSDGMPPLLGILPTLPDRLSDPEQAAVAAHCIHQLRIMLQVNGGGADRKVYMITSASAGDGKTSLTMALGLSFAASGSRTLVVDCDMVGQGLTTRLKARNSPGLLEALGAGTLNQRVKKTTTPNLFILPIGGADSAHAGSLSPASIRKLLTEARRVFDIVIIDTGPILGSLEAAVVGAAADSVVLTISRGQQQPLVDRSVRQLRQIGANVVGLVFNRAEKRDFERSVGSSSIRSISLHPVPQRMLISEGADESRFGPLARSVASFMPGNSNIKELPPAAHPSAAAAAAAAHQPANDDTAVGVAAQQGEPR
jgi:capsular exopolysaccharide synthesis family protein